MHPLPDAAAYQELCAQIRRVRPPPDAVRLVAVSKTQPIEKIAALATMGQRDFGENYVQEALTKQAALRQADLVWHLIGPLQSNKAAQASRHFDWVQSVDREKLLPLLDRARGACARPPLQVLVQVNIDREPNKHGCAPEQALQLCRAVGAHAHLCLRGLMAVPAVQATPEATAPAFVRMHDLFLNLQSWCSTADTLSMGMSADWQVALRHGANMIRLGSILFGERTRAP
jgi:PLP dependent protein